jgi:hypothetical protein
MSLLRPDALAEERAAMAMSAPLETVRDSMSGAFFEPTALRILKSSRTDRLAHGDVDHERFDSVGFWEVGSPCTGLCRTDQLIVLFAGTLEMSSRNVSSVDVELRWLFQPFAFLSCQRQFQAGITLSNKAGFASPTNEI